MVVGRAVHVPSAISQDDPRFDKAVDEIHARVVAEITRVYNEHKEEFGWADRPLEVV